MARLRKSQKNTARRLREDIEFYKRVLTVHPALHKMMGEEYRQAKLTEAQKALEKIYEVHEQDR